jgi:hypothetical protein
MFRTALGSLFALAILAANVQAADFFGTLKKVDADKGILLVAGGPMGAPTLGAVLPAPEKQAEERSFQLDKDTKILDLAGKELKDGLKAATVKPGATVIVTTENKNGAMKVTQVKIGGVNSAPGARPKKPLGAP